VPAGIAKEAAADIFREIFLLLSNCKKNKKTCNYKKVKIRSIAVSN